MLYKLIFQIGEKIGLLEIPFAIISVMKFFTYQYYQNGYLQRIGKGHSSDKTEQEIARYLSRRYGKQGWDESEIRWHSTESAAYKAETKLIDEYVETYGFLPPLNQRRGGGGRHVHLKCKASKISGRRCINDALASNYGFCGVHR